MPVHSSLSLCSMTPAGERLTPPHTRKSNISKNKPYPDKLPKTQNLAIFLNITQ